ncbi:hypothetical protein ACIHFD_49625 [Nonomuraea sp. NPDC051941]|uniref:hypothetical protein n=1 Tax=Nonomuraea sp. NPDC051941 TaxID=3364373 RepID=UPI0037CBCEBC
MTSRQDQLRNLLDGMVEVMPVDEFVAEATRRIMGPLHEHPVLQEVRERRSAALLLWSGTTGEAVEQVITAEQANDLRAYYEQLREQSERDGIIGCGALPPTLPPPMPGHWATVYGVRLMIEDPTPVLGEYTPTDSPDRARGLEAIRAHLLPAGTAVHVHGYAYMSALELRYGLRDRTVATAKKRLAASLGRPHFLAVLGAEDLAGPFEYPAQAAHDEDGWGMVYGFTLQAIPGATPFLVLRPAPSLPPGLLHPDRAGRWERREPITDPSYISLPVVHGLDPSRISGQVSVLTARATGRVEINADRAAAEVYEVTP